MKSFPQGDGAGEDIVAKSLQEELHFHHIPSVLGDHFPIMPFGKAPSWRLSPPYKGPETQRRSDSILGGKEPNWNPLFSRAVCYTLADVKWKKNP